MGWASSVWSELFAPQKAHASSSAVSGGDPEKTSFAAYTHGFLDGDTWTPPKRAGFDELLALSKNNVAVLSNSNQGKKLFNPRPTDEEKALAREKALDALFTGVASLQDKYGPILKQVRDEEIDSADPDVAKDATLNNIEARFECASAHHGHDLGTDSRINSPGEKKILEVRSVAKGKETPWIPCTFWYGKGNTNLMNPGCIMEMDVKKNKSALPKKRKPPEKLYPDDLSYIVTHKTRFEMLNFAKVEGVAKALSLCPEKVDESLFFNACAPDELKLACTCQPNGKEQVWAQCADRTAWTKCEVGGVTRMEIGDGEETQPGSVTCALNSGRVITRPYLKGPLSKFAPFVDKCKNHCGPIGREKRALLGREDLRWEERKLVASCPANKLRVKCTCAPEPALHSKFARQRFEALCGPDMQRGLPCGEKKLVADGTLHACRVFTNRADTVDGFQNTKRYRDVVVPVSGVERDECDKECPLPAQLGVATYKEMEKLDVGVDPVTGDMVNATKANEAVNKQAKLEAEAEKKEEAGQMAELQAELNKMRGPEKEKVPGVKAAEDEDAAPPPEVAQA